MRYNIINDHEWSEITKKLLKKNANKLHSEDSPNFYIESDGFYNRNKLFAKYNENIIVEKKTLISDIKHIYDCIKKNTCSKKKCLSDNILDIDMSALQKHEDLSQNEFVTIDVKIVFPNSGYTECDNLIKIDNVKTKKNKNNTDVLQIGKSTYTINSMSSKERNNLLDQLNKNINLLNFGNSLLNIYDLSKN